jgi:hypothetical protein
MIPESTLKSDAWTSVKAHLTNELLALRERNDSKLNAEETAFLRGQIAHINAMLVLDTESTTQAIRTAEPPEYDL